ncbi:hypothetical protein TWF730_008602 [Orbilia blumenaviensis]|uniref:Uncharacterized protein n=1 Tax=Orbilia blumenaviensis TaxID=1796055 RepID=A0AAV9V570_9PEZI
MHKHQSKSEYPHNRKVVENNTIDIAAIAVHTPSISLDTLPRLWEYIVSHPGPNHNQECVILTVNLDFSLLLFQGIKPPGRVTFFKQRHLDLLPFRVSWSVKGKTREGVRDNPDHRPLCCQMTCFLILDTWAVLVRQYLIRWVDPEKQYVKITTNQRQRVRPDLN